MRILPVTCIVALLFATVTSSVSADDKVKSKEVEAEDITLTVPENWKPGTGSRLRLATLMVPAVDGDKEGGELAVYFFGGGGGGVNANLERWEGQFSSKGRVSKVTEGKSKQGPYYIIDLTGIYNKSIGPPIQGKTAPTPGYKMLGVVLMVKDKGNYFLKLTGPKKTIEGVADTFRASFGGNAKSEKAYEIK